MRTAWATLELLAALALVGISTAGAIDLQGHRGARGLAPENTLTGFRRAMTEGVSTLELDIGLTRDGVAVVHHDDALNPDIARDPAGQWLAAPRLIHDVTRRELARYDVGRLRPGTAYASRHPMQEARDGETIPTLDRLFAMVASTSARALRFNIETKLSPLAPGRTAAPEVMAEAILRTAERHRMRDRIALQSFDWRTLASMRKLAPDIPTIHLTARQPWLNNIDPRWNAGLNLADHVSVPRLVKAAGGRAWSPYFGDLDAADLAEARSLGLKVIVWTVNARADIKRMLDMGVDGLITDYPDLARRLILERGLTIGPVDWESGAKSSPDSRRSE
jgi:glycerophosphoryl diester phosphodiesterase